MGELLAKNDDKSQEVSITTKTKDGMTRYIKVEEIENGYLICVELYGNKKSDDGKESEYYSEYKKYYSKTNPLDKDTKKEESKEKSEDEQLPAGLSALKSLYNEFGD